MTTNVVVSPSHPTSFSASPSYSPVRTRVLRKTNTLPLDEALGFVAFQRDTSYILDMFDFPLFSSESIMALVGSLRLFSRTEITYTPHSGPIGAK